MEKVLVLCWEMPGRCTLKQTTKSFGFACLITSRITESAVKVLPRRSCLCVSWPVVVERCASCSCPGPTEQGMENRRGRTTSGAFQWEERFQKQVMLLFETRFSGKSYCLPPRSMFLSWVGASCPALLWGWGDCSHLLEGGVMGPVPLDWSPP